MNMLNLMYVAFGGAAGSIMRYVMTSLISSYNSSGFPYGTLSVNIVGSFLLGILIAMIALFIPAKGKDLHMLLAVGFLGGFTTFSAFSMDAFMLIERGLIVHAVLYVLASVVLSVVALGGAMWLVKLAAG